MWPWVSSQHHKHTHITHSVKVCESLPYTATVNNTVEESSSFVLYKIFGRGQTDSIVGRSLAWHTANPGSTCPSGVARNDSLVQSQKWSLSTARLGPNTNQQSCFWTILSCAQGFLLALCSGITAARSWGTGIVCDAGNPT